MTDNRLSKELVEFLHQHHDPLQPLLLALSGGPDSLALFHLLMEYRREYPLKLIIAHVDHGWRPESGHEASVLKELATNYNLPFHLRKLDPKAINGNLELECRKERFHFFAEICKKEAAQAVLLAHHKDDQSETILKRILEGASLPYLAGMKAINTLYGVTVWRPLLGIPKDQILSWLQEKGMVPFEDSTNFDAKYLRGRFRTTIIPHLSQDFGKDVNSALYRLGQEAQELNNFLDERLQSFLNSIKQSDWGSYLDLSQSTPSHFEIKYLIRRLCERENAALTHHLSGLAASMILSGVADRQLIKDKVHLYIDRKRVFIINKPLSTLPENRAYINGEMIYGGWKLSVSHTKQKLIKNDWKQAWIGKLEVVLPHGEYHIGAPVLNKGYPRNSALSKWWNNEKVPAFIRPAIPVIWKNNEIEHEFLTGRLKSNTFEHREGVKIQLERI